MPESRIRAAITGVGIVCPVARNYAEFVSALHEGRSNFANPASIDMSGFTTTVASEIDFLPTGNYLETPRATQRIRCLLLLLRSAREALASSGLILRDLDPYRTGVCVGTLLAGARNSELFFRDWLEGKWNRTPISTLLMQPVNAVVDALSRKLGAYGPNAVVSTACASGVNAIGYGVEMISANRADVMLVGGVDPLVRFCFAGFDGLKALSVSPCAPFSLQEGTSIGEGATVLVLENHDHAEQRGAHIYAEVMGYGLSADAYHVVAPDPSGLGMARAMWGALAHAELSKSEINYVNAHGTGTVANDLAETRAIRVVFGDAVDELPVSSTKSMIGHTMGAAGAIEVVAGIAAIEDQFAPPTVNFEEHKMGCTLDYVPNEARPLDIDYVLSNSFGFGGMNASVVLGRPEVTGAQTSPYNDFPIVVTGLGPVSCLGIGKEEFWSGLTAGEVGYHPISTFDPTPYRCHVGGEVRGLQQRYLVDPVHTMRMDPLSYMATAAAALAIEDARLAITTDSASRIGIIFATSSGPLTAVSSFNETLFQSGPGAVNPNLFPNMVFNAAAGHIAQEFGITGTTSTIAGGETAFGVALDYAALLLKRNAAEVCVVVSADELTPHLMAAYTRLDLLSPTNMCRPYDRSSDGLVLGAASAAVALESGPHATKRNATSYGYLRSSATTGGSSKVTNVDDKGASLGEAVSAALARGSLEPGDLDYVAAGGCGSLRMDAAEGQGLKSALKGASADIPVSAVSSLVGLCGSTSLGLGIISGLLSMGQAAIPFIASSQKDNVYGELDYVMGSPRHTIVNRFLATASSFGGTNCALVFDNRPA